MTRLYCHVTCYFKQKINHVIQIKRRRNSYLGLREIRILRFSLRKDKSGCPGRYSPGRSGVIDLFLCRLTDLGVLDLDLLGLSRDFPRRLRLSLLYRRSQLYLLELLRVCLCLLKLLLFLSELLLLLLRLLRLLSLLTSLPLTRFDVPSPLS